MSTRDYSPAELEALDILGKQVFMDGWAGFPVDTVDDDLWSFDGDLAQKLEAYNRRNARLARACRSLFKRGLAERRRCPIDGRSTDYRLIAALRSSGDESAEARP